MKKVTKLKKNKPKFQLGAQDMQSEQQANQLVAGVGAVNPIVGAFMKVGQGVGKMTQDENGLYKSKAGEFLDNNINPTTGIQNFKDLSKDFSAGTVANQLTAGLIGTSATQKRRKRQMEQAQLQANAAQIRNATPAATLPTFKTGGVIDSTNVVDGGSVQQISPTAVQVKADNPSATDSVELDSAYVDHNEVIDNQDRVFSDMLKAPSGKSVAKEAAKLEKMKSPQSRFDAANSRVDQRLDKLFDYQESLKPTFQNGGKIKPGRATGGMIDPPKASGRKLPKDVVTAYVNDSGNTGSPLAKIEDSDPIFYDSKDFNKYYRSKTVTALDPESRTAFDGFKSAGDQDAWIAAKGGVPNFEVYQKHLRAYEKSQIKDGNALRNVARSSSPITSPPNGYQYSAGNQAGGTGKPAKGAITKPKFAKGGPAGLEDYLFQETQTLPLQLNSAGLQGDVDNRLAAAGSLQSESPTGKNGGFNWGQLGTTAATYLPDVLNLALTSRLKGPAAPLTENKAFLPRINADAQLSENARQATNAQASVRAITGQASNAAANMGSILAKRLYADNAVRNQVNTTNAQIAAQETGMNTQIGARNVERQNAFRNNQTDFQNRKLSAYSQIGANVGEKFLQQKREKNMKDLSVAELEILKKKYQESGVYGRNFSQVIDELQKRQGIKTGNFKGGKLGR